MGKMFGNLAKIRGVTYFRLSPHEQKAFAGVISHGVPNMLRRINENILTVTPFFIATYLIMTWADEANHAMHRKDPKQFENDK
ncbi:cytochrome b-c1 complex subunit 8 [Colletes gigas]|uniref:cytochrome b-c1 complex subunit 8 n=1 Tax=Colletes gigas TaxID=935657 RepID=UPI001C9BA987|nr:cytochrome b-c1 complex subunit 8 [Colletes gigas]XP_043253180.1 cytochrome b-c1 complex subunit 8 [Colletes gigas]